MTTIAKIVKINANNPQEIEEVHILLQNALDTIKVEDLKKILLALQKNPKIVKTALKFI